MNIDPKLIETSYKSYIIDTLKRCHENRIEIYSIGLNLFVFLFFAIIVSITLYVCYKKKLTPYEKEEKIKRDQEYVLSKIKYYKEMNKSSSEITNLPTMR